MTDSTNHGAIVNYEMFEDGQCCGKPQSSVRYVGDLEGPGRAGQVAGLNRVVRVGPWRR